MDIFTSNKVIIFILFFVPGFISLKVYDLLIANKQRDFSRSFFDAVVYGAINFGVVFPIIWVLHNNKALFVILVYFGLFVSPVLLPALYIKLLRSAFLTGHVVDPIRRPWDWFFSKNRAVWVIVNLLDGTKIGGVFSDKSYASSFPLEEQIYIEQAWELDAGFFKAPIDGSKGVIVLGKDISSIEFFDM